MAISPVWITEPPGPRILVACEIKYAKERLVQVLTFVPAFAATGAMAAAVPAAKTSRSSQGVNTL